MNLVSRKLQMIVGECTGPPFDRTINRLANMLPKAREQGDEIPPSVLEYIERHDLGEAIEEAIGGDYFDQAAEVDSSDG